MCIESNPKRREMGRDFYMFDVDLYCYKGNKGNLQIEDVSDLSICGDTFMAQGDSSGIKNSKDGECFT